MMPYDNVHWVREQEPQTFPGLLPAVKIPKQPELRAVLDLALQCPCPQLGTALRAAGGAEPPFLLTLAASGSGVQKKEPFWFCKRENSG